MLRDIILKNRSYRGFNEERNVTTDELFSLVDDARVTGSAANRQPLKYYISNDSMEVEEILKHTKWAGALPELHLPKPGTHPKAFVIMLQDKDIQPNTQAVLIDVGIAAQTILLSATEKGLGGLMIRNFGPEPLSALLGLPDNLTPVMVIALGEPAETVTLVDIPKDGNINYYRDENGTHFVPKRRLEDIVLLKK
ncbi:nitroreductase family protein [Oribacterium sp. WCC10]|uniref:nitroreductase family protein n=1 Tax=Oribacterium sp. WCC10 TaxID=1855343 RepID=UPI0008E95424|nr:nitroreductase family protein [Oribacterium sp. WCC10]SFG79949.1 Nitroreductase [Oribacterium sp. WCC10]